MYKNTFKMDKKAMAVPIVIAVLIIGIIAVVVLSKGALGSSAITSTTTKDTTCKSSDIPVSVKGTVFVKDSALFGVVAEPVRIDVSQVTGGGKQLGVFSSDFTWNIKLIDTFTGNEVTSDSGKNNHPGGSSLVEDKYSINFFVPDNNCDQRVDNFEGKLIYQVRNDNGDEFSIDKDISFQNGRFVR